MNAKMDDGVIKVITAWSCPLSYTCTYSFLLADDGVRWTELCKNDVLRISLNLDAVSTLTL